ncbi:MAG TPA: 50S ribosomal protein L37e [archaeon]|nr:50S ribosomal protein L37e [archaeon]
MTKGTPSFGKRGRTRLHITCRRCGQPGFNRKTRVCVKCGFGKNTKLKSRGWANK